MKILEYCLFIENKINHETSHNFLSLLSPYLETRERRRCGTVSFKWPNPFHEI